jgi:pantoate--beta-alanine ligase
MNVVRSIAELLELRATYEGLHRIAFVPTMGALHRGHKSLIRLAGEHGDLVVVSIFVNPLQFGPNEDYARYPRPLEDDLEVCRRLGVDVVFVPTVNDLYPAGRQVSLNAGAIGSVLEGASRPGHFDGVLTVVLKLFNLVRPHVAVFGRKDAQQLACINRMVVDLNVGVSIVGAPTVREDDGLALSSRNRYLSVTERQSALALNTALRAGSSATTPSEAVRAAEAVLQAEPGVRVDYLGLVNPSTFAEITDGYAGEALLVVAGFVGTTRLIDNVSVTFAPLGTPLPDARAIA